MKPIHSNFKETKQKDTQISLAHGSKVISATLARDISADETDTLLVDHAGNSERVGTIIVDDEIIYYHVYDSKEPGTFLDLLRGQGGTVSASHLVGASVTIIGKPRFGNPAVADSIISVQEVLLDLISRVETLEKKK